MECKTDKDWHLTTATLHAQSLVTVSSSEVIFVRVKPEFVCVFCQSGSVLLPTGQRDNLHSNYGPALFLCSTLEMAVQMVQSQTCIEQHE